MAVHDGRLCQEWEPIRCASGRHQPCLPGQLAGQALGLRTVIVSSGQTRDVGMGWLVDNDIQAQVSKTTDVQGHNPADLAQRCAARLG